MTLLMILSTIKERVQDGDDESDMSDYGGYFGNSF